MLSDDDKKVSVDDRSDLLGNVHASFKFLEFTFDVPAQDIKHESRTAEIDASNRPNGTAIGPTTNALTAN